MIVKRLGFVSFRLKYTDVVIVTDPLLTEEAGLKFTKTKGDVVILSDPKLQQKSGDLTEKGFDRVEPTNKESVIAITSPGEYEVGGVMIRRPIGKDYYLIDEGNMRVVYMGQINKAVNPAELGDLGDVDLLILPVGNADIFPSFEKLEDIIKRVDPTYLIPCGYKEDGLGKEYKELKSTDEFVKQFGFTHVSNEKKFSLKSGKEPENKVVEVIILE